MAPDIRLRPVTPEDRDFLWRVYASTREDELKRVDWDDAQKRAFIDVQFRAQHSYYTEHYPGADFSVIVADGAPAGRLYVDERPDEIRVMDIAVLPEYRGRGIGTRLMRGLMDKAGRAGKSVSIHVEQFNPALHWYTRLGFAAEDDFGVYLLMRWTAIELAPVERGI